MANAHSQTMNSAQALALMSGYNTLGGSPEWRSLLPTAIDGVFPSIETARHDTIDPTNQYEAGSIINLTCDPKLTAGFTAELADALIPAALRTVWTGPTSLRSTATRPTSATSVHYVTPAIASALVVNTLVNVTGATIAGNNGVKVVSGSPSTTTIPVSGGLTAETFTAANNVSLEVCGFQFSSGDLTMTVSGSTITLATTTKDLTQLGLATGQSGYLGDTAAAAYSFATAACNGPFRVVSVATNAMVVEMMHTAAVTDAGASKTIRMRFGQTCRVVPRTSGSYLESWFQTETVVENLGTSDADAFIYTENSALNTLTIAAPSAALVTLTADLMASDSTTTETRRTNASTPTTAVRTVAFNTRTDISGRVFITVGGAAATGVITSANIIIENGTNRVPAHGSLADVVVFGKTGVRVEFECFLTESNIIAAGRDNAEIKANWWLRNSECAYAFDMPSGRISAFSGNFAKEGVVTLTATIMANKDATYGTSLIVSKVPACSALPART